MEHTNPNPGVSQELADVERVSKWLSQSQDQAQPQEGPTKQPETTEAQPSEQPQGQASEEPTPEDLEPQVEPQQQPAVEAFEIVHNGQQVKLSREEAIKYAMQGFDYTQKTQAIAEKDRQAAAQLQMLSEAAKAVPYLQQERAQLAALESQLGQYRNVNWVQLAQQDITQYAATRAQYDQLQFAYQQARGDFEQKEGAVRQQLGQVAQQRRQAENARVTEFIPEWRDQAKRDAGEAELVRHYNSKYGIGFDELNSQLNGAVSLAVAYKAMKYDQLVQSKSDKVKQLRTAPPVTVPGAKSAAQGGDKERELMTRLQKTGDERDAAALLANRWNKR